MSEIRVDTISEKTSANGVAIDSLSIKDGSLSCAAGAALSIDANGQITMPLQPAFCTVPTSTQSNLGNNDIIAFGTERFDQNGDFASNTFTAPVGGKYQLQYSFRFEGIDTAADFFRISMVTSNKTYELLLDPGGYSSAPVYQDFAMSVIADMDASDTAFLRFDFGGISDPSSFDVRTGSFFSGFLAC
tara:strand:- start:37 stop:600 length:564 start_codon:yes stop_codon:yes gene_type:complete